MHRYYSFGTILGQVQAEMPAKRSLLALSSWHASKLVKPIGVHAQVSLFLNDSSKQAGMPAGRQAGRQASMHRLFHLQLHTKSCVFGRLFGRRASKSAKISYFWQTLVKTKQIISFKIFIFSINVCQKYTSFANVLAHLPKSLPKTLDFASQLGTSAAEIAYV